MKIPQTNGSNERERRETFKFDTRRRNPDIENDTISILFLAHGLGRRREFRRVSSTTGDYRRPVFVVSKINREPG